MLGPDCQTRRMTKVVLAVALVVLALAGTALAERGPTKSEFTAIRAAYKGFAQMPGSPAARMTAAADAAWPMQIVCTIGLMNFIVS